MITCSLPEKTFALLNLLAFKVIWVLLLVYQDQYLLPVLLILALQLLLYPDKEGSLKYILLIALPGVLIDTLLTVFGIFDFNSPVIPLWLLILWLNFALTLPYGYAFLEKLALPMQALTGVLASLSYLIGYRLGAVEFPYPLWFTNSLLALIWAFLIPVFFYLIRFKKARFRHEKAH